jgi:hypothetical protein
MIKLQPLGQVGYCLNISDTVIYIDPYLSNSVQEKENTDSSRLIPIPIMPSQVKDADYVLITRLLTNTKIIVIRIPYYRCQNPHSVADLFVQMGFGIY